MSKSLDGQRPHLSSWTVPRLLPSLRMNILYARLCPFAIISSLAAVPLCPLAPPQTNIRLWAEDAHFFWSTAKKRRYDIFDTMGVQHWNGAGRCTVVESICSLIQSRRNWSEGGDNRRSVRTTSKQCCEASSVRLAACVYTRSIHVVG